MIRFLNFWRISFFVLSIFIACSISANPMAAMGGKTIGKGNSGAKTGSKWGPAHTGRKTYGPHTGYTSNYRNCDLPFRAPKCGGKNCDKISAKRKAYCDEKLLKKLRKKLCLNDERVGGGAKGGTRGRRPSLAGKNYRRVKIGEELKSFGSVSVTPDLYTFSNQEHSLETLEDKSAYISQLTKFAKETLLLSQKIFELRFSENPDSLEVLELRKSALRANLALIDELTPDFESEDLLLKQQMFVLKGVMRLFENSFQMHNF